MSNIIDSIRLSGVTYGIKGSGGTQTIELTQAQYDALVDKDPNTFYVITDAEAGDLTNYYTKTETNTLLGGKADTATTYTKTEVDTALATKQATLQSGTNIKTINNESILGSGNIDIQGGGGKAIEAGRGISVTTGTTADTVSFDLPISATTLGLECFNSISNSKTGDSSTFNNIIRGSYNTIGGHGQRRMFSDNFIWGSNNKIIDSNYDYDGSSSNNIICGYGNIITGKSNSYTSIFGFYNESYKGNQTLFGYYNKSINQYETSFGKYNNSVSGSSTFGDSGNTLFSVGNGTADNARHNAFEIRQNGDIYLSLNGQDVKLQDQLGGGGSITIDSGITSGSTNAVENGAIWSATTYNKEVTLDFDNSSMHYSTNFPSGCTTVKVTVPNGTGYINVYFYSGSTNYTVGSASIQNYGTLSVSMNFTDASYTIENNDVIITYPASKSVDKVGADNNLQGAIVKAVVEGAFVNENTYMSAEVDGKIKALDDKKLDATAYTPVVVDSQLNAASTNPVQNQALYDELVIEGAEEETTLTFSADTTYSIYKSTNYPNGCTKVKVVYPTNSSGVISFNNGNNQLGYATINNYGTPIVSLTFNGASYSIVDGVVVITYPTVANVDNIRYSMYGTAPDSVEAVYTQTTHLIDQVTANTTSLGGLKLVKLTQAEYDALATKDSNTLYLIVN